MLVTTLERGGEKMGNARNSIESNDEFDSGFVVSRGENRYRASRGYRRFNWREIGTRLQIEIAGGEGGQVFSLEISLEDHFQEGGIIDEPSWKHSRTEY